MGLFDAFKKQAAKTKRQGELEQAYATIQSALVQQKADHQKAIDCDFFKDGGPTWERVQLMAGKIASSECAIYRGLRTIYGQEKMELAFEKFYVDLLDNMTPQTIKTAENLKGKIWRPSEAVASYDEYAAASVAIKIHDHGQLINKQMKRLEKIKKSGDPLPPPPPSGTSSDKKLSL